MAYGLPVSRTRFVARSAHLEHGEEVHAVDVFVLDAVGVELGGEVGHRGGALDAGAHAVVVVLEDEEAVGFMPSRPQSPARFAASWKAPLWMAPSPR